MSFIHEVINYLTSLPTSTWTTLGAYLAGSTLVAGLVQVIKHKLNIAEAKKLVTSLLGLFSFLVAFADFIIQQNATNPLPTLGRTTALLVGGAVFVHRFAVSPGYYKLVVSLTKLSNYFSELSEFRTAKKAIAASVPQNDVSEAALEQFQVS